MEDSKALSLVPQQRHGWFDPSQQQPQSNDLIYAPVKLMAVKDPNSPENEPILKYIANGGITPITLPYMNNNKVELPANHLKDQGGVFQALEKNNILLTIPVLEHQQDPVNKLKRTIGSMVQALQAEATGIKNINRYGIVIMFQSRNQMQGDMLDFLQMQAHLAELGKQKLVDFELLKTWWQNHLKNQIQINNFHDTYSQNDPNNQFQNIVQAQEMDFGVCHCFHSTINWRNNDIQRKINIIVAIPERHSTLLDLHLWFLGGFCQFRDTLYCFLAQNGIQLMEDSLFYLLQAMQNDQRIGACVGELIPINVQCSNPLTVSQVYEYKFRYIFDIAMESQIGFLTVLPEEFCAFRLKALLDEPDKNDQNHEFIGQGPLWRTYFRPYTFPFDDWCDANQYRNSNRALCMGIINKTGHNYITKYI